jgi:hypothetical protein
MIMAHTRKSGYLTGLSANAVHVGNIELIKWEDQLAHQVVNHWKTPL